MLTRSFIQDLQQYLDSRQDNPAFMREPAAYVHPKTIREQIAGDVLISDEMDEFIENNLQPTFREKLFNFIDRKGCSDADIYHKAGLDRRLFSKIRSIPDYRPGKNTVLTLALALELDEKNTSELLITCGYSLSASSTFDLIIRYCIHRKMYSIDDVNLALHHFNLEPLAGVREI
jgi:hypothetical protein